MLTDSLQMSSLRWLEAGATASYSTVVEPCSFPQKLPSPTVAMFHYTSGASAIEAYWKSVAWPGQGVFIGEPLAKPFAPLLRKINPGQFELRFFSPRSGKLKNHTPPPGHSNFFPNSRQLVAEKIDFISNSMKKDSYLRFQWH